jgi:hypothetical protein
VRQPPLRRGTLPVRPLGQLARPCSYGSWIRPSVSIWMLKATTARRSFAHRQSPSPLLGLGRGRAHVAGQGGVVVAGVGHRLVGPGLDDGEAGPVPVPVHHVRA